MESLYHLKFNAKELIKPRVTLCSPSLCSPVVLLALLDLASLRYYLHAFLLYAVCG